MIVIAAHKVTEQIAVITEIITVWLIIVTVWFIIVDATTVWFIIVDCVIEESLTLIIRHDKLLIISFIHFTLILMLHCSFI